MLTSTCFDKLSTSRSASRRVAIHIKSRYNMGMKVEDLTEEALMLPSEARALLADRLVESLDPAEEGELHDLWAAEIQRRLEELRSGKVKGIPGSEVFAALRKKYGG